MPGIVNVYGVFCCRCTGCGLGFRILFVKQYYDIPKPWGRTRNDSPAVKYSARPHNTARSTVASENVWQAGADIGRRSYDHGFHAARDNAHARRGFCISVNVSRIPGRFQCSVPCCILLFVVDGGILLFQNFVTSNDAV